jgi:hypothetical protein
MKTCSVGQGLQEAAIVLIACYDQTVEIGYFYLGPE